MAQGMSEGGVQRVVLGNKVPGLRQSGALGPAFSPCTVRDRDIAGSVVARSASSTMVRW